MRLRTIDEVLSFALQTTRYCQSGDKFGGGGAYQIDSLIFLSYLCVYCIVEKVVLECEGIECC